MLTKLANGRLKVWDTILEPIPNRTNKCKGCWFDEKCICTQYPYDKLNCKKVIYVEVEEENEEDFQ